MRIRKLKFARPILRVALVWPALALLALGCSGSSTPTPDLGLHEGVATPPFYQIEGHKGAKIMLMGTVHLGPPGGWRLSPEILAALDRADRFILEIDQRTINEEAVATLLAEIVVIEPPNSLLDLVSPETARLLDEHDASIAELGMPRDARNWVEPWFIAISLIESSSTRSGFDATASAEEIILEASGTRPLVGLETFAEQLGFFDDLSPRLQDLLLRETLIGLATADEEIHALVRAWQSGNEEDLEALGRDGVDEFPELEEFYKILIGDRNRRWISVFVTLLENPELSDETIFVGVGALHLLGEDGLIQLFRKAGYTARSLDQTVKIP